MSDAPGQVPSPISSPTDARKWERWIRGIEIGAFIMAAIGIFFYAATIKQAATFESLIPYVIGVICIAVALWMIDYLRRQAERAESTKWLGTAIAVLVIVLAAGMLLIVLIWFGAFALRQAGVLPPIATAPDNNPTVSDVNIGKESNLNISLRSSNTALIEPFKVRYIIPGRAPIVESGTDGTATITGVPSSLATLDIQWVSCAGYEMKSAGPFPITKQLVAVDMIPIGPKEPWSLSDFPQVQPYLPSKEQLTTKPRVDPSSVVLSIHNSSGDDLTLVMYNCSQHATDALPAGQMRSRWITRDIPYDKLQRTIEHFSKQDTGWFVFYLCSRDKKCMHVLTDNICNGRYPTLSIAPKGNRDDKYSTVINYD